MTRGHLFRGPVAGMTGEPVSTRVAAQARLSTEAPRLSGAHPSAHRDTFIAMDIEQARFNMVEQQIRTWEVLDQGILDLLFLVRREDFVPPEYRLLAFADL